MGKRDARQSKVFVDRDVVITYVTLEICVVSLCYKESLESCNSRRPEQCALGKKEDLHVAEDAVVLPKR